MAKTKISEFDSNPANNTDIDGINLAEGMAPGLVNNAIRELMAQLKNFQSGTSGDTFTMTGGSINNATIGASTAAAGTFTDLSASGNVGIGVTPTEKLHVNGNALSTRFLVSSGGSATAPAYSFSGDTNTGIYRSASNQVGIATNGTQRINVSTTGVSSTLPITAPNGSVSAPAYSFSNDTGVGIYRIASNTLGIAVNGSERVRITENQYRFGSSVTNPGNNNVATGVAIRENRIFTSAVDPSVFNNNLPTQGSVVQFNQSGDFRGNIIVTTSGTFYGTISDYRIKQNVQPIQNALEKVSQLNPVTWTLEKSGAPGQGFIAHELQEICPDAVSGQKDEVDSDGNPKYQGVDTSFLVGLLAKAIQELNAKVDAQIANQQ